MLSHKVCPYFSVDQLALSEMSLHNIHRLLLNDFNFVFNREKCLFHCPIFFQDNLKTNRLIAEVRRARTTISPSRVIHQSQNVDEVLDLVFSCILWVMKWLVISLASISPTLFATKRYSSSPFSLKLWPAPNFPPSQSPLIDLDLHQPWCACRRKSRFELPLRRGVHFEFRTQGEGCWCWASISSSTMALLFGLSNECSRRRRPDR